jgi:hypothetical protein
MPGEQLQAGGPSAGETEPAVVVRRGVYQQPFSLAAWQLRLLGSVVGLPLWLLDNLMPIMLPDNPVRKW